jgi:hypothetical protein
MRRDRRWLDARGVYLSSVALIFTGAIRAQGGYFSFDDDAIDAIIKFLRTKIVKGKEVEGESIEPMPLEMLCSDLDSRRSVTNKINISVSDIGDVKGLRGIVDDYYRRTIKGLPWIRMGPNGRRLWPSLSNWLVVNFPRSAARSLCEMQLITQFGQRDSLQEDVITAEFGVPSPDLQLLVDH